jgi:hypothetical protein
MTPLDIVNVATAFALSTAPVAGVVGLVGHALTASKHPTVRRVGLVLEGIGWDWRRVAQAFSKDGSK